VADSVDESTALKEIAGIVDVTVQSDADVLVHLNGAKEYLYVSGIAVLKKFRYAQKNCKQLKYFICNSYVALKDGFTCKS
jgi:hypothetical protein